MEQWMCSNKPTEKCSCYSSCNNISIKKETMKLINWDCIKEMQKIEDDSVDLIITDPPYKIQWQWCGWWKHWKNKFKWENSMYWKENSKDALFKYVEPEIYMKEFSRISKWDSHIYIFTNDKNISNAIVQWEKNWLKLMNILVVNKKRSSFFSYFQKQCEFILFFRNKKWKAKYINNCGMSNYFEMNFARWKEKLHKTEKPIELTWYLVEQSTQKLEVVLDPFMWSWWVWVNCKNLNREFIGIELDENYFNIAKERIITN